MSTLADTNATACKVGEQRGCGPGRGEVEPADFVWIGVHIRPVFEEEMPIRVTRTDGFSERFRDEAELAPLGKLRAVGEKEVQDDR